MYEDKMMVEALKRRRGKNVDLIDHEKEMESKETPKGDLAPSGVFKQLADKQILEQGVRGGRDDAGDVGVHPPGDPRKPDHPEFMKDAPTMKTPGPLDRAQGRNEAGMVGAHPVDPVRPDHTGYSKGPHMAEPGETEHHGSEDYAHMREMDAEALGGMSEYDKNRIMGRKPKSLNEYATKDALNRSRNK